MSQQAGKNIVICSDGTGNAANKDRGTNVFKIFESVDLNGHRFDPALPPQLAIYDDGVGTHSFKLLKVMGGAFGLGLARNVRQLYKELCRVYDPGDRIYLFGFSRGAFTARTLGGMITTCGIIDVRKQRGSSELEETVDEAYRAYRTRYRTDLFKAVLGEPDKRIVDDFRAKHCHKDERIHFIGVWDTVDAVGLPLHIADAVNKSIYQFKFPNLRLSDRVDHACHALAIDDERQSFHPMLWDERGRDKNSKQQLEQVWFAGVHSNVGGGYPKQGMSLVALDWMMSKAKLAGLRFIDGDFADYQRHGNIDDKLYNSRDGFGLLYRWLPRDIGELCDKSGVEPRLHMSAIERVAHGTEDYCPGNLPPTSSIVWTPGGAALGQGSDAQQEQALQERASELQEALRKAHGDGPALIRRARTAHVIGRWSYRAFASTVLALVVFALATVDEVPSANLGYVAKLLRALVAEPRAIGLFSAGALIAAVLAWYSSRSITRLYSHFWFEQQQSLRAALKRARQRATHPPATLESGPARKPTGATITLDGELRAEGAQTPAESA